MFAMDEDCGYDVTFVSEVSDHLKCMVCHMVLRRPIQIMTCGHRFCHPCFERIKGYSQYLNTQLLCPVDRDVIDLNKVFQDNGVARMIGDLQAKCQYFEQGCIWIGDLREIEKHEEKCDHKVVVDLIDGPVQDGKEDAIRDLKERVYLCEDTMMKREKDFAHLKFCLDVTKDNSLQNEHEINILKEANLGLHKHMKSFRELTEELKTGFIAEIEMLKNKNHQLEKKVDYLIVEVFEQKAILKDFSKESVTCKNLLEGSNNYMPACGIICVDSENTAIDHTSSNDGMCAVERGCLVDKETESLAIDNQIVDINSDINSNIVSYEGFQIWASQGNQTQINDVECLYAEIAEVDQIPSSMGMCAAERGDVSEKDLCAAESDDVVEKDVCNVERADVGTKDMRAVERGKVGKDTGAAERGDVVEKDMCAVERADVGTKDVCAVDRGDVVGNDQNVVVIYDVVEKDMGAVVMGDVGEKDMGAVMDVVENDIGAALWADVVINDEGDDVIYDVVKDMGAVAMGDVGEKDMGAVVKVDIVENDMGAVLWAEAVIKNIGAVVRGDVVEQDTGAGVRAGVVEKDLDAVVIYDVVERDTSAVERGDAAEEESEILFNDNQVVDLHSVASNDLPSYDKEIEELTSQGNETQSDLTRLIKHIQNIEHILFSYERYVKKDVKLKWVLQNYQYHFDIGESVSSPVFHTKVNGYCFKLFVKWNGYKKESVGLYLRLCRDTSIITDLRPFVNEYTLEILDRKGSPKAFKVTTLLLDMNRYDCFTIHANETESMYGFGDDEMLTMPSLRKYIIDDTMYISCIVHL